jgi:HK97 family phage prohead protease/HK97 family phage major capsid protein
MPMKVEPGEDQNAFMKRCMHETFVGDRTQEQAVAICMSYWRDEKGGEKPPPKEKSDKRKQYDEGDLPEPDDGEDRESFLSRCVSELTDNGVDEGEAENACEFQWEDYSEERTAAAARTKPAKPARTTVKSGDIPVIRKSHIGPVNGMQFVLSDETPDRLGDIISSAGWDITSFRDNPIALFNHNSNFPIGRWTDLHVEKGALRGHLKLAEEGTSPRIDEIIRLTKAGILRAVSVGFQPLASQPRKDKSGLPTGGEHFLKQALVECSLVSVPANPNALAVVKSLDISSETIDLVFAEQGSKDTRLIRRGANGGQADSKTIQRGKGSAMGSQLAQRIIDLEARIIEKQDELNEHWKTVDDNNVSDSEVQRTRDLNQAIAQLQKQHEAMIESERLQAAEVAKSNGSGKPNGGRALVASAHVESPSGTHDDNIDAGRKKAKELIDHVARAATILYVSKVWNVAPEAVLERAYGSLQTVERTNVKKTFDLVLRAAAAPAMTTVAGWAMELAQQTYTDLLPVLMPEAVLTKLAPKGLTLSFGRAARIIIPMRVATPTIAGSFVGEGQAIPVRQGAFTSQTLTPKKLAVISTWTREMDDHSIPAIEGLIREQIQYDTTVAVDSILLDVNPATTIRPAGLLNGVAATTPTAGGGIPAIVGDIGKLVNAISAATKGNLRELVWMMNPEQAIGAMLATATNTGIFPFREEVMNGTLFGKPIIQSTVIPAKRVILMDAADFVVAGGEGPRFELSDQATLHMEDTAPADLVGAGSPGVVAAPQRSLFQTDSLALRMVQPLNWIQRRPGTLAYMDAVTW